MIPGEYELTVSATGFREKRLPPSETWERYADKSGSRTIRFYVLDVRIDSLSPTNYLRLGDDLTVTYTVRRPSSVTFDSMELHVYNASGTLVYKRTDLQKTVGTFTTIWEAAKWNQSPHSGAYANPANGDYQVKVVATKNSREFTSAPETIKTLLVLELDVVDDKPASDEISSGLFADAVDGASSDCIAVGLTPVSGGSHIFGTSPVFSGKTTVDLDNDPQDSEIREARIIQVMPSSISDGRYYVTVKRLRDKAGNSGAAGYTSAGDVSVINDWQIRMY